MVRHGTGTARHGTAWYGHGIARHSTALTALCVDQRHQRRHIALCRLLLLPHQLCRALGGPPRLRVAGLRWRCHRRLFAVRPELLALLALLLLALLLLLAPLLLALVARLSPLH